jgi:hypothetical protein
VLENTEFSTQYFKNLSVIHTPGPPYRKRRSLPDSLHPPLALSSAVHPDSACPSGTPLSISKHVSDAVKCTNVNVSSADRKFRIQTHTQKIYHVLTSDCFRYAYRQSKILHRLTIIKWSQLSVCVGLCHNYNNVHVKCIGPID